MAGLSEGGCRCLARRNWAVVDGFGVGVEI